MKGIAYVNGEYLPADEASVSIFDRGFLFADGVYEVTTVVRGQLIDNEPHLRRLRRSLQELALPSPADDDAIVAIQQALIKLNALEEGVVYLQVTRGAADRDFRYPDKPSPTLVMFTQHRAVLKNSGSEQGIKVISMPDLRWRRRDIKTVGLLAASMAKQAAADAGADDAWLVEDGLVTEGSSNNAFIVDAQGQLRTRHLSNDILAGITRDAILTLSREQHIPIIEEPFTVTQAQAAKEAFVTSASTLVHPVVEIDGIPIGDGKPGPIARRLRELYVAFALAQVTPKGQD